MIQTVKRVFLCTPDLKILTTLNGIRTDTANLHLYAKDYDELTFEIDQYIQIDGVQVQSNGYDDLKVYMYLYLEDVGYFQMQEPNVVNDGNSEYKEIQAYSAEKEFEQKDWIGLKINNGESDSLEMIAAGNVNELGFAKNFVTLHNRNNPELSFMNIMISKLPRWTIGHVDNVLENKVIPLIDVDNANVYSIMTSTIAPRLGMIFIFDYLNMEVNAYHKSSINFDLNYDTSIYIGFRNLANQVNINIDEDSVFTRFRVRGEDDLTFTVANYGNDRCWDLSYFMGPPYMSKELADKIRDWIAYRDDNRDTYMGYTKKAAVDNAIIDALEYRVPSDPTYWKQWDNMTEEALRQNLALYTAQLIALQSSVDTRDASVCHDAQGNYIPLPYNSSSTGTIPPAYDDRINHEWYLQCLWNPDANPTDQTTMDGNFITGNAGYFTYREIITYIIPYIIQAIANINVPTDQKIRYGTESEEDWSLYGYYELSGKIKSYEEDKLAALNKFSNSWSDMNATERANYVNEDAYNSQGRKDYIHILDMLYGYYDTSDYYSVAYKVQFLTGFKEPATEGYPPGQYRTDTSQDAVCYYYINYTDGSIWSSNGTTWQQGPDLLDINTPDNPMPGSMKWYLAKLKSSIDSAKDDLADDQEDYINPMNRLAQLETALDSSGNPLFTADEIKLIDTLLIDTDYTNSNILATSLDTVVSTVDRAEELYNDAMEKLSEVSHPQYNFEVEMDNLLRIPEFQGWVGDFKLFHFIRLGIRDDYSVKLRIIEMEYNPCEVDDNLKLTFSSMITSKSGRNDLTQIIDDEDHRGSKNSISIGKGNSKSADEYATTLLTIMTNSGLFSQSVRNIASSVTGTLDRVGIGNIVQDYLINAAYPISNIVGTSDQYNTFSNTISQYINVDTVTANTVIAALVSAQQGDFDSLTAQTAFIDYLNTHLVVTNALNANNISAENIVTSLISANEATFDRLNADSGFIQHLTGDIITSNLIESKLANINVANMETVYADSVFAGALQALRTGTIDATVDRLFANDAEICKLIAGQISVNDLKAGIIYTNEQRIMSQDGSLDINGNLMQFKDNHNNVRIQIGKDGQGNYSFSLFGPADQFGNQKTLWYENGITENGIPDNVIVTNMIADSQISEEKLSFSVIKPNQYGGISITDIYDGQGNRWGVQMVDFKQDTDAKLANLAPNYDLFIEAPNGTNITGNNTVTLNAILIKNNTDNVTNDYDASCFIWTRSSKDSLGDDDWNVRNSAGSKSITLTSADVTINATFKCTFTYDDTVVSSG